MSRKSNRHTNISGGKNDSPEKTIETMFRSFVTDVLTSDLGEPDFVIKMQRKHGMGIFRQRRTEAMLRLLPVVKEKCYPSKDVDNSLTSLFFTSEVFADFDYNTYDTFGDFRLGATIWILDNLKRAGNLEKAVEHLPYFVNKEDVPLLPKNFYHPCYSTALLESMMIMITMRFESSHLKELPPGLVTENIILEANTEGSQYNVAFQEIIKLLPQDMVEKTCNDFRDAVLRTVSILLKGYCYLKERYAASTQYLMELSKAAKRVTNTKTHKFVGPVASPQTNIPVTNLGLTVPSGGLWKPKTISGSNNEFGNPMDNIIGPYDIERMNDALAEYCPRFSSFFKYDRETLHGYFDNNDIEEMFLNYSVGDPFAMCFALMYLIDHGDDYPWLFKSGGCVMNEVLLNLPWREGKIINEEDDQFLFRLRTQLVDFVPEGWMDNQFDSVDCYYRKNSDLNLAQVFYRKTGCVLPSGIPNPFKTNTELSGWGQSSFEDGFVSGAAYSLYLSSQQARLPDEIVSIGNEDDVENDVSPGDADVVAVRKEAVVADLNSKLSEVNRSKEDLRSELLQVKRELKALKRSAAEDRKQFAAELLQKETELDKARLEHRELIDLRELTFNQHNKEFSSDSSQSDSNIGLPYETTKQVVIFGGHPNFLKQMKKYLPNARFVDVDNIAFNPDIVRNADVVWIQNNFMSHSQFYNVVNTARQYSVQIRYFTYSSAEKSAIQVAEDDLSSKL